MHVAEFLPGYIAEFLSVPLGVDRLPLQTKRELWELHGAWELGAARGSAKTFF